MPTVVTIQRGGVNTELTLDDIARVKLASRRQWVEQRLYGGYRNYNFHEGFDACSFEIVFNPQAKETLTKLQNIGLFEGSFTLWPLAGSDKCITGILNGPARYKTPNVGGSPALNRIITAEGIGRWTESPAPVDMSKTGSGDAPLINLDTPVGEAATKFVNPETEEEIVFGEEEVADFYDLALIQERWIAEDQNALTSEFKTTGGQFYDCDFGITPRAGGILTIGKLITLFTWAWAIEIEWYPLLKYAPTNKYYGVLLPTWEYHFYNGLYAVDYTHPLLWRSRKPYNVGDIGLEIVIDTGNEFRGDEADDYEITDLTVVDGAGGGDDVDGYLRLGSVAGTEVTEWEDGRLPEADWKTLTGESDGICTAGPIFEWTVNGEVGTYCIFIHRKSNDYNYYLTKYDYDTLSWGLSPLSTSQQFINESRRRMIIWQDEVAVVMLGNSGYLDRTGKYTIYEKNGTTSHYDCPAEHSAQCGCVFNGEIYLGGSNCYHDYAYNWYSTAKIWRLNTATGGLTEVYASSEISNTKMKIHHMAVHGDYVFATMSDGGSSTVREILRSSSGTSWTSCYTPSATYEGICTGGIIADSRVQRVVFFDNKNGRVAYTDDDGDNFRTYSGAGMAAGNDDWSNGIVHVQNDGTPLWIWGGRSAFNKYNEYKKITYDTWTPTVIDAFWQRIGESAQWLPRIGTIIHPGQYEGTDDYNPPGDDCGFYGILFAELGNGQVYWVYCYEYEVIINQYRITGALDGGTANLLVKGAETIEGLDGLPFYSYPWTTGTLHDSYVRGNNIMVSFNPENCGTAGKIEKVELYGRRVL